VEHRAALFGEGERLDTGRVGEEGRVSTRVFVLCKHKINPLPQRQAQAIQQQERRTAKAAAAASEAARKAADAKEKVAQMTALTQAKKKEAAEKAAQLAEVEFNELRAFALEEEQLAKEAAAQRARLPRTGAKPTSS
jgi:hypothetical protein